MATANDGRPHTVVVSEHGKSFAYRVPDGATVTFVWPASSLHSRPWPRRARVARRAFDVGQIGHEPLYSDHKDQTSAQAGGRQRATVLARFGTKIPGLFKDSSQWP